MKKKTIIEIIVSNIRTDIRYYGFDFTVKVNGEEKLNTSYNDDYDGDEKEIRESLENGMAEDLILENFGHELFNY